MSVKQERLAEVLRSVLGDRLLSVVVDRREVSVEVAADDYLAVAESLRDHPDLRFEQLIDLCGADYSAFAGSPYRRRYAVISHLLSIRHNWRVRLRVLAEDDAFPMVESLVNIWPAVNWFEREAFDLFGIMFNGHPDLRRILTDYGFIGHPFRKDFPVSGFMEMRYDAEQGRVIYQPITIEPREITPRIVREESYGDVDNG